MANITTSCASSRPRSPTPGIHSPSPMHSAPRRTKLPDVLYSLGDPPSISQMRQQVHRFNPNFQLTTEPNHSRYSSLKDRSDSIALLEAEIRNLRRENREKSDQIRDFRRILREKELEMMTKDSQNIHKLEKLVHEKEEIIAELSLEIGNLHKGVVDKEVKRLANLYVAAEKALKVAENEVKSLQEKVNLLENRGQETSLYDILGRFQGENKRLMEEVRRLQGQVLSQTSLSTLEREFQEVEQMQNKLIADNSRLKSEVDSCQQSSHRLFHRVSEASSLVTDCRKDLSQLTEVIRIVRKGEGVSAALILGHVSQTDSPVHTSDRPEDTIITEAKQLQSDLSVLRQFLSDIYAEQSGHICTQQ